MGVEGSGAGDSSLNGKERESGGKKKGGGGEHIPKKDMNENCVVLPSCLLQRSGGRGGSVCEDVCEIRRVN